MLRGLYMSAFGMIHDQYRQDTTSNNISNSQTTGFKSDTVVAKSFPEVMLHNLSGEKFGKPAVQLLGPMPLGLGTEGPYTDFKQGPLINTGNDFDLAIEGSGFFAVRYFDGINDTIKYTRDGSFKKDSDGYIVTSDGAYLLARDADTKEIGPMKINGDKFTVNPDGDVYVDSVKKYTLLINDFDNYNNIQKYGKNMYSLNANAANSLKELAKGQYNICQGMLEQSNVDMTSEITNMIVNLRSYQANQRALQTIDEMLGKTVNQVGAVK